MSLLTGGGEDSWIRSLELFEWPTGQWHVFLVSISLRRYG